MNWEFAQHVFTAALAAFIWWTQRSVTTVGKKVESVAETVEVVHTLVNSQKRALEEKIRVLEHLITELQALLAGRPAGERIPDPLRDEIAVLRDRIDLLQRQRYGQGG